MPLSVRIFKLEAKQKDAELRRLAVELAAFTGRAFEFVWAELWSFAAKVEEKRKNAPGRPDEDVDIEPELRIRFQKSGHDPEGVEQLVKVARRMAAWLDVLMR